MIVLETGFDSVGVIHLLKACHFAAEKGKLDNLLNVIANLSGDDPRTLLEKKDIIEAVNRDRLLRLAADRWNEQDFAFILYKVDAHYYEHRCHKEGEYTTVSKTEYGAWLKEARPNQEEAQRYWYSDINDGSYGIPFVRLFNGGIIWHKDIQEWRSHT